MRPNALSVHCPSVHCQWALCLALLFAAGPTVAEPEYCTVPVEPVRGRPVGLQITGNYFDEARLLNVAHQLQLATDWHQRTPEGF